MLNLLNIDKLSNQCNVRLLNIIDNPAWCLETVQIPSGVQIIDVDIVFVLTSTTTTTTTTTTNLHSTY